MPLTHAEIETRIRAYIDTFNAADPQGVADLFADDAVVEDPVGSRRIQGKTDILAFYQGAIAGGARLTLSAPITSAADTGAFAMSVIVNTPDGRLNIDVIELQHFNSDGRVTHMKAYFSNDNMRMLEAGHA